MIKKIFILLLLVVLSTYFVVAITVLNKPQVGLVCSNVEVFIGDSAQHCLLHETEIVDVLTDNNCNPIGENIDDISLVNIEKALLKNPYVCDVTSYKTPSGKVNILIKQHVPTIHVMGQGGQNYFLDRSGLILPKLEYNADLVVATGYITPTYAKKNLAPLGKYLQDDAFWGSQVQQIHVLENGEVELVPRVGDHVIALGTPVEMIKKLNRMKMFYTEGLNKVGWNKYSTVSLKYENQIVCKKK